MSHTPLYLLLALVTVLAGCNSQGPTMPIVPIEKGGNRIAYGGLPSVSPDGTRLVYVRSGVLFLSDSGGLGETRLTASIRTEDNPHWSPDGRQVAFIRITPTLLANGESYWFWKLMAIDVISKAETAVSSENCIDNVIDLIWSPLGNNIAYFLDSAHVKQQWKIVKADGSGTIMNDKIVRYFAWAPDGIQFACTPQYQSGIFLGKVGDSILTKVSSFPIWQSPTWLPDGSTIAYQVDGGNLFFLTLSSRLETLVLTNLDLWPVISPDCKQIAYVKISTGGADSPTYTRLYVANVATGVRRELVVALTYNIPFVWSSNSRDIYYALWDGSFYKISIF